MFTTKEITAIALATVMMLGPLAAVSIIAPPTPDAPAAEVMPSMPR